MNETRRWNLLIAAAFVAFPVGLRKFFTGEAHFSGDTERWYGIYHYFANGFYNGRIQLWNPYMNGGEPFWPYLGLYRMIDPLTIALLALGRAARLSLYRLYHVQFILKYGVSLFGVYLFLKPLVDWRPARVLAAIFFATYAYSAFLSDGHYHAFCWVPFIAFFFIRALDRGRLSGLGWSVYFSGLYVGAGSYNPVLGAFFLSCLAATTLVWNRPQWAILLAQLKGRWIYAAGAAAYLAVMSLPTLVTYRAVSRDLFPLGRAGLESRPSKNPGESARPMYAEFMHGGSAVTPQALWEWSLWYPNYLPVKDRANRSAWYLPLRAVSLFTLGLALLGMIAGQSPWKRHFLVLYAIMLLTSLGTCTPAHHLFYFLFWPLRFVRHVFFFHIFTCLPLVYFQALGFREIHARSRRPRAVELAAAGLTLGWLAYVGFGHPFYRVNQPGGIGDGDPTPEVMRDFHADFPHDAHPWRMPVRRIAELPRPSWYALSPALYETTTARETLAMPLSGGHGALVWTKGYHEICRLGADRPDVFNAVMGVGQDIVTFRSAAAGKARFAYKILSYVPDELRLSVTADRDGALFFRDGYTADWSAWVDGRPEEIMPVDIDFKSLLLGAGAHDVLFLYRPRAFIFSAYAYLALSLLIPLTIAAASFSKKGFELFDA